jgi:SAM-dependent methyltransferase
VAYEELKQRQSVVWGTGPYQRITETLEDIHELVIDRLTPRADRSWLDLACGTGAVAERAASLGAPVTAIDLAPALIQTARERAAERDLDIDYRVGDCERLEIDDASFDVVSSTLGIMFAPDHEAVAGELARVVAPGGRLALANWTPTSGIADLFKLMAPFQPAPPPSSPFDWGDEATVRELLGDAFTLTFEHHNSPVEFASGDAYWELFATSYAPPGRSPRVSEIVARSFSARSSTSSRPITAPTGTSRTRASTCWYWASGADQRSPGQAERGGRAAQRRSACCRVSRR